MLNTQLQNIPSNIFIIAHLHSWIIKANDALQAAQAHIQQQKHRLVDGNSAASEIAIGRRSIFGDEYERLRWFSYPWEAEIEGISATITTNGDVESETGTAPIDPTRYRASLLQNGFQSNDKVDEKRHWPVSEQLETSNDSNKDNVLGVSKYYTCVCVYESMVSYYIHSLCCIRTYN